MTVIFASPPGSKIRVVIDRDAKTYSFERLDDAGEWQPCDAPEGIVIPDGYGLAT